MKGLIFFLTCACATTAMAQNELRSSLETTYAAWREAMIRKDGSAWNRVTAEHRRVEVRNRILSAKKPFPGSVFELPAAPPSLQGLTFLQALEKGPTAKAAYFGKVDFGIGGTPSDNLLVLSFVRGNAGWLYDTADFVNLSALPKVRKELAAGDLKYLKETPETKPDGKVPSTPIAVQAVKYVAKVYVFCPGREVQVQMNKISRHRFANAKEAEIVNGGAVDGPNEIQYTIKKLPGGTGKEAMTIRVYLLSTVPGVIPIKAFEYQIAAGEKPKASNTENFIVTQETAAKLQGR
ncbi:MAG: hypothetical protein EAZ42_10875 [Verrucomicrobia bacterium]|nr:MAG: hypothetical protein EAZ42_10875 [Verrucomicrobiota bacterium]